MERSKQLLPKSGYEMTFEDGNTWSPRDIENNLTVKVEKGKRKQKRVARVLIKDPRVSNYANFVEYGYNLKNNTHVKAHPATHFMRDGLTETRREVEDKMVDVLRESLDKLR